MNANVETWVEQVFLGLITPVAHLALGNQRENLMRM